MDVLIIFDEISAFIGLSKWLSDLYYFESGKKNMECPEQMPKNQPTRNAFDGNHKNKRYDEK